MRVLDPVKPELEVVVSCRVGVGTETELPQERSVLLATEPSLQPVLHALLLNRMY